MNPQRRYFHLHIGNVFQLGGAGVACYGIDCIAGLGITLIVAGVILVALANFEYDSSVFNLQLPRKPRLPHIPKLFRVPRVRRPDFSGARARLVSFLHSMHEDT